jgi:hypothetical protein
MGDGLSAVDFALLVTDRRSIFVEERTSRALLAAIGGGLLFGPVGGVLAGVAAERLAKRRRVDYPAADLDALAREKSSIVILHPNMRRVSHRKGVLGSVLTYEFVTERGQRSRYEFNVTPPDDAVKAAKARGLDRKTIFREYLSGTLGALQATLPPGVVEGAPQRGTVSPPPWQFGEPEAPRPAGADADVDPSRAEERASGDAPDSPYQVYNPRQPGRRPGSPAPGWYHRPRPRATAPATAPRVGKRAAAAPGPPSPPRRPPPPSPAAPAVAAARCPRCGRPGRVAPDGGCECAECGTRYW